MANNVFANCREISCKQADGKTICAFPDVCFTPPENPATPPGVPIPYPNTAFAKDTTSGSKHVKISGREVMLKNKSYFKTSTGDEAGCAAKKGVITSKIKGKAYFINWSMDVKFEGENVVRHLDMTTNNHASPTANESCPWPQIDTLNLPKLPPKPCNKTCPKEPDEERKKELRRKTPSDKVKEDVNKRSSTCPVCGKNPSPKKLAADHIVPYNIIMRMPGFACMSKDDQIKIINSPDNFVGLCGSCNSSKCAKLWFRWKEHKKKDLDLTSKKFEAVREKAEKATHDNIKDLKSKIRVADCE